VWKGGAVPVTVNIDRTDGFDGAVDLRLENVPPGFSAPASNILPEDNTTAFALSADATAATPDKVAPLKLVPRAMVGDQQIVREATGGLPKAVEPGEIHTMIDQAEVTVRPGG